MCKYCEDNEPIIKLEDNVRLSAWHWGWAGKDYAITMEQAEKDTHDLHLFVDRGYVRLADPEDCQCIDHGQRVKIKYCPFCGVELNAL